MIDLTTEQCIHPFVRRVDTDIRKILATADGNTYIHYFGRYAGCLARIPNHLDAEKVKKSSRYSWPYLIQIPYDEDIHIVGRDLDGMPLIIARSSHKTPNEVGLIRLGQNGNEYHFIGGISGGSKPTVKCAMGSDGVVYLILYASRKAGCKVIRWTPGDDHLSQITHWSGSWCYSNAFVVSKDDLLLAKEGKVYAASRS